MRASSSAYVVCDRDGRPYTYHFTGVTGVDHTLSLSLDSTSSQGADVVNGARNLASQVTISAVETDVEHGSGWAASMLSAMAGLKKGRHLCKVVTSIATYDRMLLTEISATQDGENQYGWSGSLTFTEYIPAAEENQANEKANNNSSNRTNKGNTGAKKITGSVFLSLLERAGIKS